MNSYCPKYVMATLKIPMEIKEDGSTVSLTQRSEIMFSECNELPPEYPNYQDLVSQKLSHYLAGLTPFSISSLQIDNQSESPRSLIPAPEGGVLNVQMCKSHPEEEYKPYEKSEEGCNGKQESEKEQCSAQISPPSSEIDTLPKLVVYKEEIIKPHTKKHLNTSFKRHKKKHNYTAKVQSIMDEDVDLDG